LTIYVCARVQVPFIGMASTGTLKIVTRLFSARPAKGFLTAVSAAGIFRHVALQPVL